MSIKLDAAGRPHIVCPKCDRMHLVRRNKDYETKPQTRFKCGHCKTAWHASEEEQKQISDAYANGKKRTPRQSQGESTPKPNEGHTEPERESWSERVFGVKVR